MLAGGCAFADRAVPATDAAATADAGDGGSDANLPAVRCEQEAAWSWMSDVGKPDMGGGVAVWADGVMLAYAPRPLDSTAGGVYDPVTDTWRPMAFEGSPPVNRPAAAVWTGTELLLWSGQ